MDFSKLTSAEFVAWLRKFIELNGGMQMHQVDWDRIKSQLSRVDDFADSAASEEEDYPVLCPCPECSEDSEEDSWVELTEEEMEDLFDLLDDEDNWGTPVRINRF